MSSSDDDDESYESVVDDRIGGIVDNSDDEQQEEAGGDADVQIVPPRHPSARQDQQQQDNNSDERGGTIGTSIGNYEGESAPTITTLRHIFPPFFFSRRDTHHQPLHQHFNDTRQRRTWGSSSGAYLNAQRRIVESVVTATVFRAVVAVYHLSRKDIRRRRGGSGESSTGGGSTTPRDNDIASVPMEEVISYLQFLSRECDMVELGVSWQYFLPALVEASRQTISGRRILRGMEDAEDPLALEVDLSACRSIAVRDWVAFMGIPDPPPVDLTDISPDTTELAEWWKSLQRLMEQGDGANGASSDQQSLHDFLGMYCKAMDEAVLKYTCRGMTSNLGSVQKRKCGMLLEKLGHPSASKMAYFRHTTRRLVACDLVRVFGGMKLNVGFNAAPTSVVASEYEELQISSDEGENDCDNYLKGSDSSLRTSQEGNIKVQSKQLQSEVDLFPSDDEEDEQRQNTQIYRRLKRGIAPNTTSSGEKRVRSENKNDSNQCEVSHSWKTAHATYKIHSDEDDDDSDDSL